MFTNDNFTFATMALGNFAAPAAIGTAAATVDIFSAFNIAQIGGTAAAPIAITLPNPTNVRAGLFSRVINSGTGFLSAYGSMVSPDTYKDFMWDGNSWNPESEKGTARAFKQVLALVAGNNTITHNLGLAAPFISVVDVRDTFTGERVEVRVTPASETANSLIIAVPLAYATAAVTVIG